MSPPSWKFSCSPYLTLQEIKKYGSGKVLLHSLCTAFSSYQSNGPGHGSGSPWMPRSNLGGGKSGTGAGFLCFLLFFLSVLFHYYFMLIHSPPPCHMILSLKHLQNQLHCESTRGKRMSLPCHSPLKPF